jgi:N utilization substance protein A
VLGEYGLSEEQGNEIIMAARAHWFDDEPEAAAPAFEEAADADPHNEPLAPKGEDARRGKPRRSGVACSPIVTMAAMR